MKPIAITIALLAAGFYGATEASDYNRQVELGSMAVAACANVAGCILDSKHADATAVQVFNVLTGHGSDADELGYMLAMKAVRAGVVAKDPSACKAMLAHSNAVMIVTGSPATPEVKAYLKECAK